MPFYESVFIARQEISTQQVDALADIFSEVINDGGGKVTKKENWGLKNLAYKIKKSRKAHYTLFNIDAPAETIHEMERQMRLNEDVVRYMTIRVEQLSDEPSVQAQNKTSQSDDGNENGEFKARSPEERDKLPPKKDSPSESGDAVVTNPDEKIVPQPSPDSPDVLDAVEQESEKNESN